MKNLTEYVEEMTVLIESLEADYDTKIDNYDKATECTEAWLEAEKEFDGYMAAIVGMGLSYESVLDEINDF